MSTSTERMRRLRARRAAGLTPADDGPPVRDPDNLVTPAVRATLAALGTGSDDAVLANLALAHARVLDTARDELAAYRVHGPALLKILNALGGTPASRARMQRPVPRGEPNRLDALRAARAGKHPL